MASGVGNWGFDDESSYVGIHSLNLHHLGKASNSIVATRLDPFMADEFRIVTQNRAILSFSDFPQKIA